ncbi:MAG: glutamine amidotransferase family protein [Deltaproteobacteria bacterium]|uniref:Glutamine amidotransferase family protein n=1 Tax=Candidatus Zymogenus saltonus TaxID=2844893 RepID=A0A9D8KGB7_9DELT|nr:glutamine amidotransferase family protein [Candidatus Zymogenus saltonus]
MNLNRNHNYIKDISGCGLSGIINRKGERISGSVVTRSIANQHDRGNGLGGGFAAYGIYPEYKELYALHIMYDHKRSKAEAENFLKESLVVSHREEIRTRITEKIQSPPILMRYFTLPNVTDEEKGDIDSGSVTEDDLMVKRVMHINDTIEGAFVFSSGKNMGAFKGVGFPEDISEFFMLEDYKGHIWTAHNRFPTNTPGWWGGAHPFTILDWSIVHNGEISSYGINKRYLEMFGYKCTLLTDTEVVAYLLDLLIRKHGLSYEVACLALASPFWQELELIDEGEAEALRAIRMIYGPALLNGPFAILFANNEGLVGLNDRVKLRPLVAAEKGDFTYMASEESAIREICPDPDRVWAPIAGEPVIALLDKAREKKNIAKNDIERDAARIN